MNSAILTALPGVPASPPTPAESNLSPRFLAMLAAERRRKRLQVWFPWIVAGSALLLWEAACAVFSIPTFILPPPSAVAASAVKWWHPLIANAAQTLSTTIAGFALAVCVGMTMGVLIGSSTLLYRGLYPLIIAFESVPKVAIVPLLVIWFGIGTVPAVITSFLVAFFPIMVNVSAGIAAVEPELRDVLRSLGASHLDIVRKVGIPRSLPYFFASLKIAITFSFVGSIIAETIGANSGIGHLITLASSRFDVPLVFAGLIVTSIMGVTMYIIALAMEKRTTGWAAR